MSDDCDGYLSRERKYLNRLQRERRAGLVRIDYEPSDQAIAAIEAMRGDSYPLNTHTGIINTILEAWIEQATGTKYRRLQTPPTSERVVFNVIPVRARARANNFGKKKKPKWLIARESRQRVICAAQRRRDGKPCQAKSEPGKRRCKWHGGRSTGPKTPDGRQRALANLRQFRQACANL